jgi:hypothetical protein
MLKLFKKNFLVKVLKKAKLALENRLLMFKAISTQLKKKLVK